jgi:hypothetical protein
MYIVLEKGRSVDDLAGFAGIHEATTAPDGECTFIVRQELKKD